MFFKASDENSSYKKAKANLDRVAAAIKHGKTIKIQLNTLGGFDIVGNGHKDSETRHRFAKVIK